MGKSSKRRVVALLGAALMIFTVGCHQLPDSSETSSGSDVSGPQGVTAAGFPTGDRWKPEEFVISSLVGLPYGAIESQNRRAAQYHKEAFFNTVELVNLSAAEMEMALEACKDQGLQVIVGDPALMPGASGSDEEIQEKLRDYAAYEDIIRGFFICDEPNHDMQQYEEIARWNERIRQLAPTKLMFSNLFPSYGPYTWSNGKGNARNTDFARYADDFFEVTDPDVLSVDYYVFAMSTACEANLDRNGWWRDWGYFRQRSIETGKPFWCYIQSLGEFAVAKKIGNMTGARIAVQVNAAVAYGAKGVSYYNSLCSLIDERAFKTELYDEIRQINQGAMTYGNILLDKQYDELYHTSVPEDLIEPYFADKLEDSRWFTALPDGVLVSTFTDKSDTVYMMIVNRSYTRDVQGDVLLKKAMDVSKVAPDTGEEQSIGKGADTWSVTLPAGGAALYILR